MNEYDLAGILLAPLVSEKSVLIGEKENRYIFKVHKRATKLQIKRAVESMLNVEVEAVQTLNLKGKSKHFGRTMGKRPDWKKAYVKLKPGHEIDFSLL
jgi:large subunit ribosomal protein L23